MYSKLDLNYAKKKKTKEFNTNKIQKIIVVLGSIFSGHLLSNFCHSFQKLVIERLLLFGCININNINKILTTTGVIFIISSIFYKLGIIN
ncbi:hypothetical protein KAZ01_00650 [Candidatus Gracilibacteria bacterium]|nr:hypothetical protein [Candidatus Gracilibacteria bacterium]